MKPKPYCSPEIIAETVIAELEEFLNEPLPDRNALAEALVARAEHVYKCDATFRKQISSRGNAGRDYFIHVHATTGFQGLWLNNAGESLHESRRGSGLGRKCRAYCDSTNLALYFVRRALVAVRILDGEIHRAGR